MRSGRLELDDEERAQGRVAAVARVEALRGAR
jgi:hypothetical protein